MPHRRRRPLWPQRRLRGRHRALRSAGDAHRRRRTAPRRMRFPPGMTAQPSREQRLPEELPAARRRRAQLLRRRPRPHRACCGMLDAGEDWTDSQERHRDRADAGRLLSALSDRRGQAGRCRPRAGSSTCSPTASAMSRRRTRPACSSSACANTSASAPPSRCRPSARPGSSAAGG